MADASSRGPEPRVSVYSKIAQAKFELQHPMMDGSNMARAVALLEQALEELRREGLHVR